MYVPVFLHNRRGQKHSYGTMTKILRTTSLVRFCARTYKEKERFETSSAPHLPHVPCVNPPTVEQSKKHTEQSRNTSE